MTSLEDRYKLTAGLAYTQRESRLLRGAVRPTWAADGSHFWHSTRQADGLRHVLVDVQARQQTDLFDHAAVAAALSKAAGKEVAPGELGLGAVRFDRAAGTVSFVASGARWAWSIAEATLARLGADFAAHESGAPDGTAAVCWTVPTCACATGAPPKRWR